MSCDLHLLKHKADLKIQHWVLTIWQGLDGKFSFVSTTLRSYLVITVNWALPTGHDTTYKNRANNYQILLKKQGLLLQAITKAAKITSLNSVNISLSL